METTEQWVRVHLKPTKAQRAKLSFWMESLSELKQTWFDERNTSNRNFTMQQRSVKTLRTTNTFQHVPATLMRSLCWSVEKSWLSGNRKAKPTDTLEFNNSGWKLEDNKLLINQIGEVKFEGSLPESPEKLSISYRGGRWSAYLQVVQTLQQPPSTSRNIGIDLGVKHWSYLSNGMKCPQHEQLFQLRAVLAKHQKALKSKEVGSTRYTETVRCIERTKQRIEDAQRDRAMKHASWLTRNFDVICIEEVNERGAGISNHPIYKQACKDANWNLLTETIIRKASVAGKKVVLVPPFYSSQECSKCGAYSPKGLDDRTHHCKHCGLRMDRDRNASEVIRKRGILILTGERKAKSDWTPKNFKKKN